MSSSSRVSLPSHVNLHLVRLVAGLPGLLSFRLGSIQEESMSSPYDGLRYAPKRRELPFVHTANL